MRPFSPRPYQELITRHIMETPRCAVWAAPGLGKTGSTLQALDNFYLMGRSKPTLIIAPLLVAKTSWPEEVQKWSNFRHLEMSVVTGTEDQRVAALKKDVSLFVTNFENIEWLVKYFGSKWPFAHVVVDEATRLKGFRLRQGTKRARALASVSHRHTEYLTELTGTPSPNGLTDLWGQAWFLDGGQRLGTSYTDFLNRWFYVNRERFICRPYDHAQREIQAALRDLCLTIEAKDWFDLREPIVSDRCVELPTSARQVYKKLEKEFFAELADGEQIEAVHAAALSNKLLQVANGAAYGDDGKSYSAVHDAKLQALESIVNEAGGAPVLVSYNFRSDAERILKAFPQAEILTKDTIEEMKPRWNAGKIPIMLVHPASAGHGLSLQDGGNILVFFGQTWNLEHRLQIIERIGPVRQLQAGHDRPMFIYNIIARDTIDELVMERVTTKREVQDILLEAMARRN